MIVRISTEGQYEVPDTLYDRLNELDNATVAAVEADDAERFRDAFEGMLRLVREQGTLLGADDLRESAIVLPPPDLTLAEARADGEFAGEGLLPD